MGLFVASVPALLLCDNLAQCICQLMQTVESSWWQAYAPMTFSGKVTPVHIPVKECHEHAFAMSCFP